MMGNDTWPLGYAASVADRVRTELLPFCDRCEIAGSIRRRKERVKDIEVVCIPKQVIVPSLLTGAIDQELYPHHDFVLMVNRWLKVKGKPTGKYTQRMLPEGIPLDLFMATPENWGLIFAIRTGSAEFSHQVLAKGWVRAGYRSEGGVLMRNGTPTFVREERDLFELLGIPWVEPEERA